RRRARPRQRARRALRVRVLRPAARRAAGALHRARAVGSVSGAGEVTPHELALVVPCYNEASRLDPDAFVHFLTGHPGVRLVMGDEGSVDGTADVLERIRAAAPADAMTIRLPANGGKGEAGRARHAAGVGRPTRRRALCAA